MKQTTSLILDSIFFEVPDLKILSGAYLQLLPGEITAIIGRNGAGKSTLLKIAAGQQSAISGITIVDGIRIYKKSPKQRFKKIGYLPQESMLPPDITVHRLIKSFPSASYLFDESFLKTHSSKKVGELSGGEKRLLEVLLLLSLDRKYILLDEPFTGVEPYIINQMVQILVEEAKKGKGILLTDHLHRYVSQVATKGYLLHNQQCYKLEGDIASELKKMGYIKQSKM
ncbi:MAG: ATP-binding cassette domain-containing protein [Balneolaceae bacterium]